MAPERIVEIDEPGLGLRAAIVIDSTVLGPAAGGIRTRKYAGYDDAVADATALAEAMTIKCALAGLDAGGGKCVVMDTDDLDRTAAFERLGEIISELGGLFRTGADMGTTPADLAALASRCEFVHTEELELSAAVARGLVACARPCAELLAQELSDLSVAVQGCGSIGTAVASALVQRGCKVTVADLDASRAQAVAADVGAQVVDPERVLLDNVDVVAPCATGDVITEQIAADTAADALCGAANNIVSEAGARVLVDRNILWVPDVVASAGAVIEGIGRTVMGIEDRSPAIDALGDIAREILVECRDTGARPDHLARQRALARLARSS